MLRAISQLRKSGSELGITGPVDALRVARNFFRTIWDPTRSDIQHGINKLVFDNLRKATPEQVAELEESELELVRMFNENYDPALSIADLSKLPEDTLGREYARFVTENQIQALETLLSLDRPVNTLEYMYRRAYKLHDIMHIVLGADASVLGEVKIVSFTLGQKDVGDAKAPAMALGVLFMNIGLRRPHEVHEAIHLAAKYHALGQRCRWHVTTPIEEMMARPVGEVRELLLSAG